MKERKSSFQAFLWALMFGPIGLMYVSPFGGLLILILMIATAGTIFIPALLYLVCILYAPERARQLRRISEGKAPY
jgi:O-antigen ligase